MKKEEPQKISLAEVLIIVIVLAVTIAIAVSAIVRFVRQKGEIDGQDILAQAQAAFSERGEGAIGTAFLPESGVLTYDTASGKIALYREEEVSFSSGFVTDDGFRIRVNTADGERLLAAYSQSLIEDYRQIEMLSVTCRVRFTSRGVERDFIHFVMAREYADTCFVEDNAAFTYTRRGKERASAFSFYEKVMVCDKLEQEGVEWVRKFSSATQVLFADLGDYELLENVLYTKGGVLVYALPCVESVVCPDSVYRLEKGCFRNATGVSSLEIPYTGKSVSYLFDGDIPKSLKRITFTSSLTGNIPPEDLEGCEGIVIIQNF